MQKYTLILAIILSLHAISLWQTKTIPAVAGMHEYLQYDPKQVNTTKEPIVGNIREKTILLTPKLNMKFLPW